MLFRSASDAVDSGMVSVIGLDSDTVKKLCVMASETSGAKVEIANYLCTGNYAVSGATEACNAVIALAKPDGVVNSDLLFRQKLIIGEVFEQNAVESFVYHSRHSHY